MKYTLLITILIAFSLSGCGSSEPKPPVKCEKRAWMVNPNQDGKTGAVGSSMRTYSGSNNSQRKLAITRALDELSLQQGVKVNLNIDKRDLVTNNKSSTSMDTKASYSASNKVTAHIVDACKSNSSGEFFVWMVMD